MSATVEEVELTEAEEQALRPRQPPAVHRRLMPRYAKLERVQLAVTNRATPFGAIRLAWAPLTVLALVVSPRAKPLRGKPIKDWRIELLLRPNELPTPKWRRYMRDRFGQALCGYYRTTPNPNNPLPQSVEGWWWHGGCWTSNELAGGLQLGNKSKPATLFNNSYLLEPAKVSSTEMRRLSIWLEAKAEGRELPKEST